MQPPLTEEQRKDVKSYCGKILKMVTRDIRGEKEKKQEKEGGRAGRQKE